MKQQPFTVNVPQATLDDLQERLARTRWPNQLRNLGWTRGVPIDYLGGLAEYWRTRYDWRTWEAKLNAFPQFTTLIDGQSIHFMHVRSPEENAKALLLCHGYPGSVVDFMRVIEPLTNPRAHGGDPGDAFHVVAVSLPGLGLSPAVQEAGWNLMRTAQATAELMQRLGYKRYGAQAGDAGAGVTGILGAMYPDRLIGIHMNGPEPFPPPTAAELAAIEQDAELSEMDRKRIERMKSFEREGSGYLAIQSTRPYTIGYGLNDSPVFQLAWIVEKYYEWTDPANTLPEDAIDIDQILTNVSVYWFTGNGAGAANFLYENMNPTATQGNWGEDHEDRPLDVGGWGGGAQAQPLPSGVAVFAADNTIRKLVDRDGSVVHYSEFDQGGHFPAMEVPELFVNDLRAFFKTLR